MASPAGSRRRYGGVPRCGRRPSQLPADPLRSLERIVTILTGSAPRIGLLLRLRGLTVHRCYESLGVAVRVFHSGVGMFFGELAGGNQPPDFVRCQPTVSHQNCPSDEVMVWKLLRRRHVRAQTALVG